MGFYTDWFIANESDAPRIASVVTTEEHSFEDWPNLSMKGIGEMELSTLWGILRGDPDSLEPATGTLLFQGSEQGLFVCRVVPGFVQALAAIELVELHRLASEWKKCDGLADWDAAAIQEVLREMIEFSRGAEREGRPVVQLSVL